MPVADPTKSVTAASATVAGNAGKLYSKALRDTAPDRDKAAHGEQWDKDGSGHVDEEEAYVAEMALLERQKAILDIILLIRDKIRQFSATSYANIELKKVFKKFDPDGSGEISWFEFDNALQTWGIVISEEEMGHLMELFDADGSGQIAWAEFVTWCDDRVPLNLDKIRKILEYHKAKKEENVNAGISSAYKKKWLEVHRDGVDMDISVVTQGKSTALVGNVKLLGDRKKVEAALEKRKSKRKEVIDKLRAAVTSKAGDIPLKDQLDAVWRAFDVNGDGTINWKEFTQGMSNLGLEFTPKELSDIMKEFDTNCDGSLDYLEFVGHLMPPNITDVDTDFDRCTAARRAMLMSRGISREGTPIGVRKTTLG